MGAHEGIDSGDEEDTGSYHGCRVNQGADGGGAFHCVGKPDVEWDLAGLTGCAAEDENADDGGEGEAEDGGLRGEVSERGGFKAAGPSVVEEERAGLRVEPDHAKQECEITDAGGDEGFLCGGGGLRLVVPEADEEIGGEADDLPAHEEQKEAVGDDDAQHGPGEERHKAEEAREVLIVSHVAHAVDEDEQAYEGNHQQHQGGQRIKHPA